MCLVIEFLSDLLNVLAVSLSRRCHPHIFQKLSLVCPHNCAHMETDTVMNTYICTPTNHLKILSPSLFLSATAPAPTILLLPRWSFLFKACLTIACFSVIQLPGDSLQDHRWNQRWLAFPFLMPSQFVKSIYHQDV